MIGIQIPGLAYLQAKLTPALVREPAAKVIQQAAQFAVREAQTGSPRDTGAVASSISARTHGLEARITASLPALVMEFGRHSTRMPPTSALAAWAARHGLAGLEFPIARAIARRGIKGRHFIRRAREKLLHGELPRLLRNAASEIEQRWAA